MLFIVGLGLWDEKDVTMRGLETIRKCSKVYLEAYTSVLLCDTARLEELYGKAVVVADREMVESGIDVVLEEAKEVDVAFLVVGDPFGATTHADLVLRARQEGVAVQIIHNASIMNAVGACGLQLYRFGEAVSIPFFTDTWRPDSFYDRIKRNRSNNTHTLCLLDIKVKEPNLEALAQGRIRYEPPRYMTVNTAIAQLLEIEEQRKEQAYSPATVCVGVARLGSSQQAMVAGCMDELARVDFGAPLHSLVIAADDLHEVEREYLDTLRVTADTPRLTEEPGGVADDDGGNDDAL